jgi:hypothetical protein
VWDGAAEGGSRGGYWTNARKAFQFVAVGTYARGLHKAETFYLDKDELEESDSGSRLWGLNYEAQPVDKTTLGVTYMRWFSDAELKPGRDGLDVFNLRAYTAPFTAQVSYRYAFFQGDDPETVGNEAFDPLFLGFYDWGTWWQGEIAGEYFLSNSNLISNMVRLHVTPNESISGGLFFFKFSLDQPGAYGPEVTSTDVAFEMNAYTDWKLNQNFTLSLVGAYADPGKAVQQSADRTKNFAYGMVYLGYSY